MGLTQKRHRKQIQSKAEAMGQMRYSGGLNTLQHFVLWGVVVRCHDDSLVLAAKDDNQRPENWYKKYDEYPPYCSIPEEMESRAVPPLPEVSRNVYGETRIQHVSAIIRHGARTPWSSNENCFPVSFLCWLV